MEDSVNAEQTQDTGLDVASLVQMFESSEENSEDARKRSERNRDYRDNVQLTAKEIAVLETRNQPPIILNHIAPKVDFLLGFESSNRTDPKAFPRTPQDENASEAATDGLRYLKDKCDLDQTYSAVWENILVEGLGGLELIVEPRPDGTHEISVKHWPWDRLFYDPHSRNPDFSDATYVGGVTWMDEDEALALYGEEAKEAIASTIADLSQSQTYEDRPAWQEWASDKGRKRVRIVQMYYQKGGQWIWCHFTKGGKLAGGDVTFQDQDGESWCPMLLASAYTNRKNERYGLVDIMIGPQDEINKRRSKALHLMSMAQTVGERGAVDDVQKVKREKSKPDGHIEINPGFRFDFQDNQTQLQGHVLLLQEAKDEIEKLGPNAAMLGNDGDAPSGKAILANKASGQTAVGFLFDRLAFLKKRTYQRLWDLIRQYKKEQWWVRVTDDERNVKFVGFNRPVTFGEELKRKMEEQGTPPEEIEQQIQGVIASNPAEASRLEQVARMENVPSDMHMDITIEEVPDTANIQAEQFEQLVQLSQGGVQFPQEVYIRASGLRDKDELLELLESQQSNPQQQEIEQAQIKLQFSEMEAKIAKLQAETEKIRADGLKALTEADLNDGQLGQIQQPEVIPPPIAPPPNGAAQEQFIDQDIPPQQGGF